MALEDYIRKLRPTISDSSIKTYCSLLRSFYKKMYPNETHFDTDKFLEDKDFILQTLKQIPTKNRKTLVSAIVVLTNRAAEYKDLMMLDIQATQEANDKQTLTEKQKDNWVSESTIADKLKFAMQEFGLLLSKPERSTKDIQKMQNFIILALYGGKYLPPRRALDYAVMKTKGNIDEANDNYIDVKTKKFVFNQFKTAKSHGTESLDIPTELWVFIQKWLTVNKTGYLLIDTKNAPLSAITLNQRMNGIFNGKHVGVNQFRKTYLTSKFHQLIPMKADLQTTMKSMGSSPAVSTSYIKDTKTLPPKHKIDEYFSAQKS